MENEQTGFSAQDILSELGGNSPETPEIVDTEEQSLDAELETPENVDSESQEPEDASLAPEADLAETDGQSEEQYQAEDVEEISVTDSKGRSKNIKVDWNNRDWIKQQVKRASKVSRMQAQVTKYRTELEKYTGEETQEALKAMTKFNEVYEEGGERGLLAHVLGDPEAYNDFITAEYDKIQARAMASPEELRRIEAEEQYSESNKEAARLKKRLDQFEREQAERESKATQAELASNVNPAFNSVRFAGKLGDEDLEHDMDDMLWTKSINKLAQLEESGTKITKAHADKVFNFYANKFNKLVKVQADKVADKTIKSKKQDAQFKAQKSVRGNTDAAQALESGNPLDFLKRGGKVADLIRRR